MSKDTTQGVADTFLFYKLYQHFSIVTHNTNLEKEKSDIQNNHPINSILHTTSPPTNLQKMSSTTPRGAEPDPKPCAHEGCTTSVDKETQDMQRTNAVIFCAVHYYGICLHEGCEELCCVTDAMYCFEHHLTHQRPNGTRYCPDCAEELH